jgi:hypothetical protein
LLHLPLEPAKGVLEGFPLLKPHFSHAVNTPSASQSLLRLVIIGICLPKSSDFILFLATKDKGDSKAPHSTASLILPAVIALAPRHSPDVGDRVWANCPPPRLTACAAAVRKCLKSGTGL